MLSGNESSALTVTLPITGQEEAVKGIVEKVKQGPLLGMFGPSKVNVLKLNMALDEKAD